MNISRRNLLRLVPSAAAAATFGYGTLGPVSAEAQQRTNLLATVEFPRMPRPKREIRGIWIHPERYFSADGNEGRRQVRAMVDRYVRANFNLILPWTVSEYLQALTTPEYQQAHPTARWDSLGVLIEESEKVGLEVDLWYSFTDYRDPKSPEFDPALGGDLGWSARRLDEVAPDSKTGRISPPRYDTVCPQHYKARAWQQRQLATVFDRYPKLHGLHIEEPGYTTRDYCLCDLCRSLFETINGKDLLKEQGSQQAEDLRTIGTNAFFDELRAQLVKTHPQLILSANGGPDWRHDRLRGRDWGRWGMSGWPNYYASQVYEQTTPRFRDRLALTINDIGVSCPVVAGIALDWSEGKNTIDEVLRQIEVSRQLGASGVALFHGAAFKAEDLAKLRSGPFSKPA